MIRTAWLTRSAQALRNNLACARRAAPGSRLMAPIKASAYGHGLEWAAGILAAEVDALAVATVGEGMALRNAGIRDLPIAVLNGPADAAECALAATHQLDLAIHQRWQVEVLAAGLPAPISVWVKIDTGMGRVGVRPEEAAAFHEALRQCPSVRGEVGLMTHMAHSDDRADGFTLAQWETFQHACGDVKGPRSAANSACVLNWPETHADWVRPGIMLWGCSPFVEGHEPGFGLEPVMTLHSRLIAINQMPAGAGIGYGSTWICPEDMPVGVVAIGYGDGYPRAVGNGTPVLLRGERVPIVGRVSMDKITIDLRTLRDAAVGDEVVLWGAGMPVEEIAIAAATIPYDLLTAVHGRAPFA